MFVIGATRENEFANIRRIVPEHFYLVPGVGTQGGSLKEISERAMIKDTSLNSQCGILVNVSRAIIYASGERNFADEARANARQYQAEMTSYLQV
jgi:orotidine-5'-phosphate decarboxylase